MTGPEMTPWRPDDEPTDSALTFRTLARAIGIAAALWALGWLLWRGVA